MELLIALEIEIQFFLISAYTLDVFFVNMFKNGCIFYCVLLLFLIKCHSFLSLCLEFFRVC